METTELNDADLWNEFIKGNESAYKGIYQRFYMPLHSYGMRMTANKGLVDDAIQDLFVKLILNHSNLNPIEHVQSYLLLSLRNKILDTLKSNRFVELKEEHYNMFLISDHQINTLYLKDDQSCNNERLLVKALNSLSKKQREILYLHYIKELNHKEIAAIMKINEQSSKNLLFRTLVKLRNIYLSLSTQ